jgi:C1A family cysteine protease
MQALLLSAATASIPSFSTWSAEQGKTYATREELVLRRSIYAANVAKITQHNAEAAAGEHTWTMGVNKFSDMTADEFKARMTGGYMAKAKTRHAIAPVSAPAALPASVNWTANGVVTPVKDQQQCGSCWAFSATGSMESAIAISGKPLPSLSEQQLVDCSDAEGNEGCNGGLMDYAFQYVIDNKGITSETQYPYKAVDQTCNKAVTPVATISKYTDVAAGSETALMTAIVQQPISVAVEADQNSFQSYQSGIMTAACGTALDHGVLAVGYGTVGGQDYYLVKNSWGAAWGSNGYILLGRGAGFNGANGQCGIQMDPSYPTA